MNMQQTLPPPRSSSNGYGHHKVKGGTATSFFNKTHESNSCDRLIYLTTCLIGHQVEVQVHDGSVYSGIFHAINEGDYGVILKMAYSVRNGSQGQKNISDSSKTPSKTLIIPATDLVQVIAKDVHVIRDGFLNELQREKHHELMIDSCISQSQHSDAGRELERWVPDEDDPGCPELENIFDGPWNRGWDQFEVNKTLFGVKSTFDEELYTTKLDRGPQTRELEREALKIAREIEGEQTLDLHLAEERGIQIDGNIEMDEETRFSSVYRGTDGSTYEEIVETVLDLQNDETFGDVSVSYTGRTRTDINRGKSSGTQVSLKSLLTGARLSSLAAISRDAHHPVLVGYAKHTANRYSQEDEEMQELHLQNQASKAEDSNSLNKEGCAKVGLSANATAFDPSRFSSKGPDKGSFFNELPEGTSCPVAQGIAASLARTSSSASSTSDHGGGTSTSVVRGLSPSSSVASLSSEKSTLNPHAKEFKMNANAKSFVPFQSPRPSSPVAENSFYYPPLHGFSSGVGAGPSFAAQQPVMYNPPAAPITQQYYNPNGPQYGQQMTVGQHQPIYYMPTYPH
ncbi:polyadenylate-binding protein-interacting protein 4-like isoform X1 [Salvia splendens]|uniref:polyadenylate-binding protein-interacting protein 4-like isoform X1 n=1 Tax=Salvia splendens TaxID=180675 RepID=UPI001C26543B|nr:polyadenylate-binding protein-interacting protein 4-like isoform X1 [Salvia splendens]XP_042052386.1 polyadenylate-binding protein-interacting protein 4-like isoform X1 [Salvia splendens]